MSSDSRARIDGMRLGIAHHLGWAVAVVAADPDHLVVDRRRVELIGPGLPPAPVHHPGGPHDLHRGSARPLGDDELASLVAEVRASVTVASAAALDDLARDLAGKITSISVREMSDDLPSDISVLRRPPLESRVDSYMYCQVLAAVAAARGWDVHRYDARRVESDAADRLGGRADDVLRGPRAALGPPWAKDHRVALAATVLAP